MTFDKLISSDLTALGVHGRQQLRTADEALRALARRDQRAASEPRPRVVAQLALERVFVLRAARAATAAVALACALALLVGLYAPGFDVTRDTRWWWLLEHTALSIALPIAVLLMATHLVAAAIARWRFDRATRDRPGADDTARRLVRSTTGWQVALAIAGGTCLAAVGSAILLAVGLDRELYWLYRGPDGEATGGPVDLGVLLAIIVVAAAAIGHACTRRRPSRWVRAGEHRVVTRAGLVVGAFTLCASHALDLGAAGWHGQQQVSSNTLCTFLTVASAVAVFLVNTGHALRQRRRDRGEALPDAAHADDAAAYDAAHADAAHAHAHADAHADADADADAAARATSPATADVRAPSVLARMLERRTARLVAGVIATAYAAALLIIVHNPFGGGRLHRQLSDHSDEVSRWREWLLNDQRTMLGVVALLVLAGHMLGAHLARQAAERSLCRSAAAAGGRDAIATLRDLVRRVDGASIAAGIAGVASLATFFGLMAMTIDNSFWVFFRTNGPRSGSAVTDVLRATETAFVLALVVALSIGRACAREPQPARSRWLRLLEHRAIVPAGAIVCVIAGVVGARVDFGVFDISLPAVDRPAILAEIAWAASSAVGILLVTIGFTLRRRRREQDGIVETTRSPTAGR